jgi:SAM-dependent methyltransferase
MIICPQCRRPYGDFEAPSCLDCAWTLEHSDALPVMLSAGDRGDPTFRAYLANYDEIARDDLDDSIQPEEYLEIQGRRLAEHVGPLEDLDVCDLGVGQGRMVRAALAAGAASVTGVDIAAPYMRRLKDSGARLVIANAENLPFREEFDVLVASEILEHVLNPGDMLLCAYEALRRGGRFIVRVPYREDLRQYARLRNDRYRFVHLRSFTRELLRLTLEQSGFRVKRLILDGFDRDRVREPIRRHARTRHAFERFMDRSYPTRADVYRMEPWLGRLLIRPYELTAVAYKDEER